MRYSNRFRAGRRAMAVAAAGALVLALVPALASADMHEDVCDAAPETVTFSDVTNGTFGEYIRCIAGYGIVDGFEDGTYRSSLDVARGQAAKFVVNLVETATGEEMSTDGAQTFTDVPPTAVFHSYIEKASANGIIDGFPDGTYRPTDSLRRGQMAKIVANALEQVGAVLDDSEQDEVDDIDGNIFEEYITKLLNENVVQGFGNRDFRPAQDVTRGQLAQFVALGAGVLHAQGLWTPTMTPTNQTFSVTPSDDTALPVGDDRSYTAAVGEGVEVEIALVECGDVTTTNGIVTFEAKAAPDDDEADLYTGGDASITEANGVIQPVGSSQATATGDANGNVTFTVDSSGSVCVVPVVWADANDDGELNVDGDGEPTEDFGIGGAITFANITDMDLDPESAVNAYGTTHTVTATLTDGTDTVPADGQTVNFRVIADECPEPFSPQDPADIFASGSATTVDGVATFTYTGPADPDTETPSSVEHCIVAQSTLSGDYATTPATVITADGADGASKTWTNDPAVTITAAPAQSSNLVSTNHTVTATVEDEFGNPVAGETVRFEVERGATLVIQTDRTTNANGVATLTYTGPAAAAEDTITVCMDEGIIGGVCDDTANADHVDEATKFWVTQAVSGSSSTAGTTVVGFNKTANTVDTDGERFTYQSEDQYTIVCGADNTVTFVTNMAGFETALTLGDTITISPYTTTGVSVIELVDEDDTHPTCAAI